MARSYTTEAERRRKEAELRRHNDEYIARSKAIVQLRNEGYKLRELANVFGLSVQRIHQILTENG